MPTYKVTTPDGRTVKLTGDNPPTEQELEEVFSQLGHNNLPATNFLAQRQVEAGLLGGTGQPMSREEAVNLSRKRFVERSQMAGQPNIQLANAGTPEERVIDTDQLSGPLKALSAIRSTSSGQSYGLTNAGAKIIQDLLLKANLTTPEAVKSLGLESQKRQNPIGEEAGQIMGVVGGQFAPLLSASGRAGAQAIVSSMPKDALGKIIFGAGTAGTGGAVTGATSAIEEKGLDVAPEDIAKRSALYGAGSAFLGALVPGAIEGAKALPGALRGSAESSVSKALDATTKRNKAIVERITPEILNKKLSEIGFTKSGIAEKSAAQMQIAGEAIEEFGKLEGNLNPKAISSALGNLKEAYMVDGRSIDDAAISRIEGVQSIFDQYGDSIPAEGLREIRRAFDKEIATSGPGHLLPLNDKSLLSIKKVASDEIRSELASLNPDLDKLNKNYNFWANLNQVSEDTLARTKPQKGLIRNIAGVAGAAGSTTPPEAAARFYTFRAAMDLIQSPGWNLASAKMKNKLADVLTSSNGQSGLKDIENIRKSILGRSGETMIAEPDISRVGQAASDVPRVSSDPAVQNALQRQFEGRASDAAQRAQQQRFADLIKNAELDRMSQLRSANEDLRRQEILRMAGQITLPQAGGPIPVNRDIDLRLEELINQRAAGAR